MDENIPKQLEKLTLFHWKDLSLRIWAREEDIYLTVRAKDYNVKIGLNKEEFWIDSYEIKNKGEHLVHDS
jgi:hypothetical protein